MIYIYNMIFIFFLIFKIYIGDFVLKNPNNNKDKTKLENYHMYMKEICVELIRKLLNIFILK